MIGIFLSITNKENKSKDSATNQIISDLKKQIENLTEELQKQKDEYVDLKKRYYENTKSLKQNNHQNPFKQRMNEDTLIKYKIVEDDDYWRVISLEEYDTISFNREFDKSKDNHNWINEGDALITLKVDNVILGMNAPTIIKSPVSGIFEYNINKMIPYNDEICRIRKYPQSDKEEIISTIEKRRYKTSSIEKGT